MKSLPAVLAAVAVICSLAGCRKEQKLDVAGGLDPAKMPTMKSEKVATLISDSGITQYKIVTPLWLVYEEVDTPYWHFPKGLYLKKFDRNFNVIATVACDSAKYFKMQKLWKLDGNVELTKAPKDLFQTQQLFWNEREHRIYSDRFIHIETPTHVLEGSGFWSDERLERYRVIQPTGIFPVNNPAASGSGPAPSAPAQAMNPGL